MLKKELEEALEKATRKILRLEKQVEVKRNCLRAEVKVGMGIRDRLKQYEERYGDIGKRRLFRIQIHKQCLEIHDFGKAKARVQELLNAGMWYLDLVEVK